MSEGIEEYRRKMEEKFKKDQSDNSNKEKENKSDSRQQNEQPPNVDPDYEYARRVQQMMDNEEHEVYDMRNVNEQPKGNQENKIQRQKTAPRQDPIELSDMSRDKDKGNNPSDEHRIGFDDYGDHNKKETFFDSLKGKFMEHWEDMSQQGKCSAMMTCCCCFLIFIVIVSSF